IVQPQELTNPLLAAEVLGHEPLAGGVEIAELPQRFFARLGWVESLALERFGLCGKMECELVVDFAANRACGAPWEPKAARETPRTIHSPPPCARGASANRRDTALPSLCLGKRVALNFSRGKR